MLKERPGSVDLNTYEKVIPKKWVRVQKGLFVGKRGKVTVTVIKQGSENHINLYQLLQVLSILPHVYDLWDA